MNAGSMRVERLKTAAWHLWRTVTLQRRFAKWAARREFLASVAALRPGDLVIDLGANVGRFTSPMADRGADVIAFEPDPEAFSRLEKALGERPNVKLVAAAAGTEEGEVRLYRHPDFDAAPDVRTKSSSVVAAKANVDPKRSVAVRQIDFLAFLRGLDRDVALLKIDIEGAEVPLMEALLASDLAGRVAHIFVETHERSIPEFVARTRALRSWTQGLSRPRVNWNWH